MTLLNIDVRRIRFGVVLSLLALCIFVLLRGGSSDMAPGSSLNYNPTVKTPLSGNSFLHKFRKPERRVKATFVSLARNTDLGGILLSIRHVEQRFNSKYHYDWVFLNNEEFTEKFVKLVTSAVSGKAKFGVIPKEHWSYPEWIDQAKAARSRERLAEKKVLYAESESYRHMCRFESGFFFRHELMEDYDYYWRVEPDVKIMCDINYDVFQFMEDNDKWYGWTVGLPEVSETIPTLWAATQNFVAQNPQYVAKNNNYDWLTEDEGITYNGCHFWSNFEVAALKFWRSEAYLRYFEYLDKAGGFFYERWGDAPIHSIAASIFMPKDKLHFFEDIGYYHAPFSNCPVNDEFRKAMNCDCHPKESFTWTRPSCVPRYYSLNAMRKPQGWENYIKP